MTEPARNVPNTRSPGTPVCHPNDDYLPPSDQETGRGAIRSAASPVPCEGGYVELHAASAFSFLAGASQPEALINRAAELGMPSIALSDRNGLYGAARFHTAAKRRGVRAHIGAEIAVSGVGNLVS